MMNTKIKPMLFVLTSHATKGTSGESTGFYLSEVTHPLAELEKEGIAVEFASIAGGKAPVDGLDLTDPINEHYWNSDIFQSAICQTQRLKDIDIRRYSGIFFAGGHGTMWDFPNSTAVQRVTCDMYEAGGLISAVCHGPSALVNVKLSNGHYLVDGKRIAAFTDNEERAVKLENIVPFLLASTLLQRGANHQHSENFTEKVVVDGQLITGQNPQSATGVGRAIAMALTSAMSI